jgi:DNA-directed RNA polymerase subunit RPC12/RpoP
MDMNLICPECKNSVDLTRYPSLEKGHVVECNMCGISLLVKDIKDNTVEVEIVDEGK